MNVIQSYLTTVMKGDFSLYETRIFVKIVEHANQLLNGQRITNILGTAVSVDGITANIEIPIKEILTDGTNDYGKVYKAACSLSNKTVEYYDRKKGKWAKNTAPDGKGGVRYYTHLIDNIRYPEGNGLIKFTCATWLLQYILDFVNGNFTMYDLATALSLPSAYCVRMYWLTCSMTKPIPYPIQMLREMLGVGDKYPRPKDFIRRVIAPPAKIFEQRGLNGYVYKAIHKHEDSRTSKITAILLIPVKRQETSTKQLAAKLPANSWIPAELRQYLSTKEQFTSEDFAKLKTDLFEFAKIPKWRDIIVHIANNAAKQRAGKGYIINGIRSEIRKYNANKPINH